MTTRVYSAGTVSVAADKRTVTLSGGAWNALNAAPSSLIVINGAFNFVNALTDMTHLALQIDYTGTVPASGLSYAIYPLTTDEVSTATANSRLAALLSRLALSPQGIPLYMDGSGTTDQDPGSGCVRVNSATSPTIAYISKTDNLGNDISSRLATLDDSVNAVSRAALDFFASDGSNAYLDFDVTGALVDGGTYYKVPVVRRSGSVPADKAALAMTGVPSGKDGTNGVLSSGSAGTVDNALLRANGTAGTGVQGSPVVVDDSGNMSGVGTLGLAAGTATSPAVYPTGDGNTGMFSPAADTLGWSTVGTERVRLDSNGNLGIGITPGVSKGVLQVRPQAITGGAPQTTGTTDAAQVASIGGGAVELDFGVYASGDTWTQPRLASSFATNYNHVLNPNGGHVLIPKKPAFFATYNGATAISSGAYLAPLTAAHNVGGYLNATTGFFTAPVSGLYHFDFGVVNASASGSIRVVLAKNSTIIKPAIFTPTATTSIDQGVDLMLAAGDSIGVFISVGSTFPDTTNGYNFFSGHLIG